MVNRKCRNSMPTIYFQNEQIRKDKIPDRYDIRFELFVARLLGDRTSICVVSVELWVVCGRLLWDWTSTKQWSCAWLFEKGLVRFEPGLLALLKCCRG